ncbi:MAG: hypothetical protein JSS32_06880 [Verrucomicrobia bacterium]|nr:hypothetical protein [Verrucomicrobiota bacterium]
MARFAVVCAAGIGDALILHIASHFLKRAGHDVATFTNHLQGFGKWLPDCEFRRQILPDQAETALKGFDAVIVQHDNTPKARAILALRPKMPVYTFYTNYRLSKHGPLLPEYDFPFDENRPMVENVKGALKRLFSIDAGWGENGLKPLPHLVFRKHLKRIAIHPTSTLEEKNWPREKFLRTARWLKENGYDPVFIAAPSERELWDAPLFPQLEDLASFIYESGGFLGNDSGPGHIASYFGLPYLIIGKQERQMRMWRPGWHPGEVAVPPSWLPNLKGLRLRDEKWKHFITTRQIIKSLKKSVLRN